MLSAFKRRHAPLYLRHLLRSRIFSTGISDKSDPIRSDPPPIRIAHTSSAGRGVFATRAITAGDTIHSAKPLVTHPSLSRLHEVCYYCLRRKKGEDGVDTGGYYFCSNSCRENSIAFHEVENRGDWSMLNEYCRSRGLKYPLMVKRLACMVLGGAVSSDCLDILQPTSLHFEMLLEMEDEYKLLRSSFKKANIADDAMAFLSKEWYINVLARLRVNAFRIELACGSYEDLLASAVALVGDDAAVGNAVYIVSSFYNHDCDPNAHIVWVDSADAKMKALRHIEEGEELRICYIDASMDVEARQKILLEGFGFHCNCLRCLLVKSKMTQTVSCQQHAFSSFVARRRRKAR
ncbi:Histone-lysine N-methyltransferase ATXR4 [Rhynchospora pubera]|uniref:Histone-lysine N-methyltransferase ATXR4 n=1 Tax=Rhynchospora pubera TaxID=906938 RepID=A0AAV8C546_9POAL|nr:Histone-lysine N-methyltransferase ATXR4 [Rhynchospora pubera]